MIRGAFGPIHPFAVEGWAFDDSDPTAQLAVEFRVDGVEIGGVIAGTRLDGRDHAEGGVEHGFFAEFPTALPCGERHRLTVRARGRAGDAVDLPFALPERPRIGYPFAVADPAQRPVFVLGSPRSGTTAVMEALRSCTRYRGPGEGHLLELSVQLHMLVRRFYADRSAMWTEGLDTLISAVPDGFLLDAVRHAFVTLAQVQFPTGRWLDKTPGPNMIAAAPLLRSIWPNARFIFCKRRGIENVASRLRRMPERSFEEHCRDWALCMANWLAVRDRIGPVAIEVEHQTLARRPAVVGDEISRLLSLAEGEARLVIDALTEHRHERSTDAFARLYGAEDLPWDPARMAAFHEICGPMMRRFGYTLGADRGRAEAPG